MSVSNSLVLAQLILDYSNALMTYTNLQAKAAAENRPPTDAELDELARGDDAKRARFQADIDAARKRVAAIERPTD